MTPSNHPLLEELKAAEAKATPGEWNVKPIRDTDGWLITPQICATTRNQGVFADTSGGVYPTRDAQFIAASRNALPKLIRAIEVLESNCESIVYHNGDKSKPVVSISNKEAVRNFNHTLNVLRSTLQTVREILG